MSDIEGLTALGNFSTLKACFRAGHVHSSCFHNSLLAPLWPERCGTEHFLQTDVPFDL